MKTNRYIRHYFGSCHHGIITLSTPDCCIVDAHRAEDPFYRIRFFEKARIRIQNLSQIYSHRTSTDLNYNKVKITQIYCLFFSLQIDGKIDICKKVEKAPDLNSKIRTHLVFLRAWSNIFLSDPVNLKPVPLISGPTRTKEPDQLNFR